MLIETLPLALINAVQLKIVGRIRDVAAGAVIDEVTLRRVDRRGGDRPEGVDGVLRGIGGPWRDQWKPLVVVRVRVGR